MANLAPFDLDDRQRAFVAAILDGKDPRSAARDVGYSESSGYRLTTTPKIQAALRAELVRRMATEGLPLAYSVLVQILRDENAPARVRVDAAKTVLDRGGMPAQRAIAAKETGEKSLSEMTTDELRNMVDKLESALSERAKPIDSDRSARPADDQAPDFLE